MCEKVVKKSLITVHRQTHMSIKKIECPLCHLKIKYKKSLLKHAKIFHTSEEEQHFIQKFKEQDYRKNIVDEFTYQCSVCSFKFLTEKLLENHKNLKYCNKLLYQHKMKSKPIKKRRNYRSRVKCKLCLKILKNSSSLEIHIKYRHKNEQKLFEEDTSKMVPSFSCEICDLKFLTDNSLSVHKSTHQVSIKCYFCNFEAENRESFTQHCKNEHGKADKVVGKDRIQCMFCEKILKKCVMSAHRKTHVQTKKFVCNLCYAKFKTSKCLRGHEKQVHTSEDEKEFILRGTKEMLKFKCDNVKCNLVFLNENLKQKHSKEHTSFNGAFEAKLKIIEKPRTYCILCHFEFKSSKVLKEHRKRQHPSEAEKATFDLYELKKSDLKFTCTLCDKKFTNISNLKYHRQFRHKEEGKEENISCEFCNKVFKWKNRHNLGKHIQSIHSIFDYNLEEYSYSKKPECSSTNFLNVLSSLT